MSALELKTLAPLKAHRQAVLSLDITKYNDKDVLVSASKDKSVYVWHLSGDTEQCKLIKAFEGHRKRINSLAVSRTKEMVVSASSDSTARIWDIGTKNSIILSGHTRDILCTSISCDGRKIATGSADGNIIIWNTEGEKVKAFGPGFVGAHRSWITALEFRPNYDNVLVSGSADGTVKVWDVDADELLYTFIDGMYVDYRKAEENKEKVVDYDDSMCVTTLGFSKDGLLLFYGGRNSMIYIINLQTKQLMQSFSTASQVRSLVAGESDPIIAVSTQESILVWNILEEKVIIEKSMKEYGNGVFSNCLVFFDNYLYCGLSNGDILAFELFRKAD